MSSSTEKVSPPEHSANIDLLRSIPSVDACLREALRIGRWQNLRREYLTAIIRRIQNGLREEIMAGRVTDIKTPEQLVNEVLKRTDATIQAEQDRLGVVINGTGVILHTNLGRALLAQAAVDELVRVATNPVALEYDLEHGARGDRDSLVEAELCALTGAEAATVVNNNAAAVFLALNTMAEGREVIVSRGELIEIGGSFRMPDIMAKSGVRLREVGTTNRTHLHDYARAIGPDTALLLKVHPSNYRIVGFTAEVQLEALVELGRRHQLPVMEDLGSGALVDLSAYGLPREPVVAERIRAGADLVTFSGDKLLGGPQAGIIVGKRKYIERIKANPLKRALRCGKLSLAALRATLLLYLRAPELAEVLPTLKMLRRPTEELAVLSQQVSQVLAQRLGEGYQVEPIPTRAQVGSGAMPVQEIPSWGVAVSHRTLKPDEVAAKFRRAHPPIIGRIEQERFIIDLRSISNPDLLLSATLEFS